MIRKRTILLGTLVAALALTAVPASAQDTATTFEVTGSAGPLSISVPASEAFSLARNGGQVDFVNPITVTDARETLSRSWSTTVSGGAGFVGAKTSPVTIQPSEVTYQPGAPADLLLAGVLTASVMTTNNVTLDNTTTPVVGNTGVSVLGLTSDTATWTPSLVVAPASGLPDDIYTGTITHSVSG